MPPDQSFPSPVATSQAQPAIPPNVPPTSNKPGRILKILLAIFIVVTVFLFSSVFYWYIKSKVAQNNVSTSTAALDSESSPNRISEEELLYQHGISPVPPEERAIPETIINRLRSYKKGQLTSQVLVNTVEGTVTDINTNGLVVGGAAFKVQLKMISANNAPVEYNWNEKDIEVMEISEIKGDTEEKITIDQIQKGDKLAIKSTIDLYRDFNRLKISIQKHQ